MILTISPVRLLCCPLLITQLVVVGESKSVILKEEDHLALSIAVERVGASGDELES